MGKVKKIAQRVLENANIINTGEPTLAAPSQEAPKPLVFPPVPTPALQEAVSDVKASVVQQERQRQLAKIDASTAGRASTILTRRRRNRDSQPGTANAGAPAGQTYTNSLLGE